MRPIPFGPDGADAVRRAYRRSAVRGLRLKWSHRGLRGSDVFLASYPRSGNLWLRFMLVTLIRGEQTWDDVRAMAPYVGQHRRATSVLPTGGRLIKTHEAYLPAYRRAINLVRDPRDIVISYFKFLLRNGRLALPGSMAPDESFDRFVSAFVAGRIDPHGTWASHVRAWSEARIGTKADIHLVRYEDMRADTVAALSRIAEWLGMDVPPADVQRAVDDCAIDRMRLMTGGVVAPWMRPAQSIPPVVNKGLVGGWRDVLTAPQAARFEAFADELTALGYDAP